MLSAKILSSDATINNYSEIGSLEFIAGDSITLVMQLTQPQRNHLRYVPEDADVAVTVHIPKTDGTNEDLEMAAFPLDHSIWSVDLPADLTAEMAGGNFSFTVDELGDGSKLNQGSVQNGLSLIIVGGEC